MDDSEESEGTLRPMQLSQVKTIVLFYSFSTYILVFFVENLVVFHGPFSHWLTSSKLIFPKEMKTERKTQNTNELISKLFYKTNQIMYTILYHHHHH